MGCFHWNKCRPGLGIASWAANLDLQLDVMGCDGTLTLDAPSVPGWGSFWAVQGSRDLVLTPQVLTPQLLSEQMASS